MDATHPAPDAQTRARLPLYLAACIPFALGVIFHTIGWRAQAAAKLAPPPALAFDQYLVNLGEVEPTAQVYGRFGFTNTSDHPVTIHELKPSCGCLNPRLEKRTYAPGESGEFYLRVQTANEEPGPKEYFCKVLYEDIEPREVEVRFKVTLPDEQVAVRPRALIFYQPAGGAPPPSQKVVVTDYRAMPLRVTSIRCTSDLITATLGDAATDSDGVHRTYLSVAVTGSPTPGKHRALVRIFTNDPEYPELRVPLMIQTYDSTPEKSSSAVDVRPQLLVFQPEGDVETKHVVVTDRRSKPLHVTAVSAATELVSARLTSSTDLESGGKSFQIEVTRRGEIPPTARREVLTITTDDPERREIQVRVLIQGREAEAGTPAKSTPTASKTGEEANTSVSSDK